MFAKEFERFEANKPIIASANNSFSHEKTVSQLPIIDKSKIKVAETEIPVDVPNAIKPKNACKDSIGIAS